MPFEYRANVVRTVDGDTLILDVDLGFSFFLRNQTVRLLGIDCPESRSKDKEEVKYGKLATKFTQDFCKACNNEVIIQTQLEDVIGENKEKFGRILANVVSKESGESLNDLLVDNFLAVPYDGQGSKEELKEKHLENRRKLNDEYKS